MSFEGSRQSSHFNFGRMQRWTYWIFWGIIILCRVRMFYFDVQLNVFPLLHINILYSWYYYIFKGQLAIINQCTYRFVCQLITEKGAKYTIKWHTFDARFYSEYFNDKKIFFNVYSALRIVKSFIGAHSSITQNYKFKYLVFIIFVIYNNKKNNIIHDESHAYVTNVFLITKYWLV